MGLPLVEPADLWLHLQIPSGTDQPWFTRVIGQVTAALNRDCGRADAPFSDAVPTRTEVLDAPSGQRLELDYPITTITSIKLGRNFTAPDSTLDPLDADQVMWTPGKREILRTDGDYWDGRGAGLLSWARGGELNAGLDRSGIPTRIQVVYATADFRPADAQLAVVLAVAALYSQRGTEGVKSESLGTYSYTLANLAGGEGAVGEAWQAAIAAHRRLEAR